jgi:hypothetical protein
MSNPYRSAQNYQYWRRAISSVEPFALDPVTNPKFKIDRSERVATAGSCFAQHISKRLSAIGFNYFVPESDPQLSKSESERLGYGVFSARYGNIYTTRQLVQLFDEAFGERSKSEPPWLRHDGRYVDPYRPQIAPDGFSSVDEVLDERARHLASVRRVFLESDIFVFTLGLTESWASAASGDVFPVAPGVSGGEFDPVRHRFANMDVSEVTEDLERFLTALKGVNPHVKVILTVSPVPLIATYVNRHVLVSTVYSKSVLRVAAEMACRDRDWVEYFPSFEIITGNYNLGAYYENDLREVNDLGVGHAMRCFLTNYVLEGETVRAEHLSLSSTELLGQAPRDIVCDEEAIETIVI